MPFRHKVKTSLKTPKTKIAAPQAVHQNADIPETSHSTVDTVLRLQSLIGNQAVQRLIAQNSLPSLTPTRIPMIQRQAYGLENTGSVGRYTDRAAKIWHTQPQMSIRDFVFSLMNLIANELDGKGIPPCGWTLDNSLGHDGEFDQKRWHMLINPDNFSQNTTPQVVKDLTKDEIQSVVGTLYHEARHADQDFLVARMLAGKGHNAPEIAAKMNIPVTIADEAIPQKLVKSSANKDQVAHAETMFEVMYGDYKEVLQFIKNFGARLQEVSLQAQTVTVATLSSDVQAIDDLLTDLGKWSQATLQLEIDKLNKKSQKSALDKNILTELKKIDSHITTISAMRKKITQPSVKNIQKLGGGINKFFLDAFKAYQNLESEADAFRVEKTVQQQFKTKI